jgi:hypothetical protein
MMASSVDPEDPVGNVVSSAPTFQARDVTAKETVSGQLNDLLSQDSKYMQSAKANANEKMNSRGLINSSMAVGASQKAAIDSALPIAQQDATTHANTAQLAQQGNQDVGLTGYKGLIDTAQGEKNFGYRTAENEQAKQSNLEINAANNQAAMTRDAEKYKADAALAKQRDDASADLQRQLKRMDIDLDLTKLESTDRNNLAQYYSNLSQQRLKEIAAVQAIPTSQLTESDKYKWVQDINKNFDNSTKTLASVYGYTYSTNWMGQPSGTDTSNLGTWSQLPVTGTDPMASWSASDRTAAVASDLIYQNGKWVPKDQWNNDLGAYYDPQTNKWAYAQDPGTT